MLLSLKSSWLHKTTCFEIKTDHRISLIFYGTATTGESSQSERIKISVTVWKEYKTDL